LAQLYPWALDSIFVASYDLQGYGGGILTPSTRAWLLLEVEVNVQPSVDQSALVSGSHLEPMARFLFSVWWLWVAWYGAPSLMKGWFCNWLIQLRLGLARAITLGCKPLKTHDHIFLSHLWLPKHWGPGPLIHIPQQQGGPVTPLGTGFTSVASYDSQGYGEGNVTHLHMGVSPTQVKVKIILQPTVSRPVCLGSATNFSPSFWTVMDLLMWGALSEKSGL
jgi:hypothetical protein